MVQQKIMKVEGDMLRGMVKPVDDPNLVLEIKSILYAAISPEVADRFVNEPSIFEVMSMVSPIQRVIINGYFTALLYRFRANSDTEVTDVITCLIEDSTLDIWLDMFKKGVLPFLISQNVYGVVTD